jgi:DNA-binding CsgD family transcriptional regulator
MSGIDELLDGARAGRGGGLLLSGEPGIGKSTLLAYARDRAPDARVLAASGAAAETGLGYGVLQQLLRDVRDLTGRLPRPQADALAVALGERDGDPPDPFLVSLAALSLLSEAAAGQTTLCLVDDLHWADQPSAGALSFAARRVAAEPVVLLASSRDRPREQTALPVRVVAGLDPAAACAFLDERFAMAPAVRDALIGAAAGNPLALTELSEHLTAAQLAGTAPLPDPLPLPGELERVFAARITELEPRARTMALVCAAAGSADLVTILRAAAALGVPGDALDELGGLVRADAATVVFRHPLVRSAAYYAATAGDRRAAHRALAEGLAPASDRRAWHLAAAATGPDEAAAGALESSAERTLRRSGYAAAADALERAARLSASPHGQLRRLAAAADAAWRGGDAARTAALLDRAERIGARGAPSSAHEAGVGLRLRYLRGLIELRSGTPGDGLSILVPAASQALTADPHLAVAMLAAAGECAFQAGDSQASQEVARLMAKLPADTDPRDVLLAGLYRSVSPITAGQRPGPRDIALDELERIDDPDLLARAGGMAYGLGEFALARRLRRDAVARARALGAAGTLAWALRSLTMDELSYDRYAWAEAYGTEGEQLAAETGQPNLACQHRALLAQVAAARGAAEQARRLAADVLAESAGRGLRGTAAIARTALVQVELAAGRPDEALTHLEKLWSPATVRGLARHVIPDLVEAAVRSGRDSLAAERLPAYLTWASGAGTPEAHALAARCRALLADPADADELFAEALRWHAETDRPLETARTALLYGEHLRRTRRRVVAREQLRSALDTFTSIGAGLWAARAEAELRATGESVRSRASESSPSAVTSRSAAASPSAAASLTAQELQVARLVSEGLTNRDVAAQLFISPRTVDHHLRGVYRKLGISTRTELARLLPA